MGIIERELNEYLFLEFGMEGEATSISESWLGALGNGSNHNARVPRLLITQFDAGELSGMRYRSG